MDMYAEIALMRVTQKWKIADNIDSRVLKREISKTDNNLFRSPTYTRVPCPATEVLYGEIAPFNYADQSNPPPQPRQPPRTSPFKRRQSGDIEAGVHLVHLDTALIPKWDRIERYIWRHGKKKRKCNLYTLKV